MSAPKKPAAIDPLALKRNIDQAIDRERYGWALEQLRTHSNLLEPSFVTKATLQVCVATSDFNLWETTLSNMPGGPFKEACLGQFYGANLWISRAREHFQIFLESGGKASDLVSNSFTLKTSSIFVPGTWITLRETGDLRNQGIVHHNYMWPYGAGFYPDFYESRDVGDNDEDRTKTLAFLKGQMAQMGYTPKEVGFPLVGGRFFGSLREKALGPLHEKTALMGVSGEVNRFSRTRMLLCLVPNRGSDYKAYELSRGLFVFDLAYFAGGKEEAFALKELEDFIESLVTH